MIELEETFLKGLSPFQTFGLISSEFFQLVPIIKKLHSKFERFSTEELKILNNNLIQHVYLFILIYHLEYAKGL